MNSIYAHIVKAKQEGEKLLAILLDPDKLVVIQISALAKKINTSPATHIFVGGSTVAKHQTALIVKELQQHTQLPIILFPGDYNQVTDTADGILFLSLLSGRNPKFLIEQQVQAVTKLKNTTLEIMPTGYILIDGGVETAVQRVSQTKPIPQTAVDLIVDTAMAGQYMGKQLIYLEAGSGATWHVEANIINKTAQALTIPLIVGGGLRSMQAIEKAYLAGADMVVIGTAFEENVTFFEK